MITYPCLRLMTCSLRVSPLTWHRHQRNAQGDNLWVSGRFMNNFDSKLCERTHAKTYIWFGVRLFSFKELRRAPNLNMFLVKIRLCCDYNSCGFDWSDTVTEST